MKNKFEGYYFKHQSGSDTIAFIVGRSANEAFIQVLTNNFSINVPFALEEYKCGNMIQIGKNIFSGKGMYIDIQYNGFLIRGRLKYGKLTPLKSDIMGLFRFFPMECRHKVVSMRHKIKGKLFINGETVDFTGGTGYIEGDSGRSFPKKYSWVQCNKWENKCDKTSVMVSVARIPFMGMKFMGCIAPVLYKGREHRFATYRGVKVVRHDKNIIILSQGKYRLTVILPNNKGTGLLAPADGRMTRIIHENPKMKARFIFSKGKTIIFDKKSAYASGEYVI